jgi:hypothetical protein
LILYVNGDSHSAGAEAVNKYCFAEDDFNLRLSGRKPHPDNLIVSYGQKLANNLGYNLVCDAESASSNDRILRTTKKYLSDGNNPDLIVIGWSTWEREEFLIDGMYYQFSGGIRGIGWSDVIKSQYKNWLLNAQPYKRANFWHEEIYKLHLELLDKNIKHLFFNTYTAFNHDFITQFNWKDNYLDPYLDEYTYYYWLKNQGFDTVNPNSYHFGPDAHQAWANHLTNIIKESIMVT